MNHFETGNVISQIILFSSHIWSETCVHVFSILFILGVIPFPLEADFNGTFCWYLLFTYIFIYLPVLFWFVLKWCLYNIVCICLF